jgi:hypothetical protein
MNNLLLRKDATVDRHSKRVELNITFTAVIRFPTNNTVSKPHSFTVFLYSHMILEPKHCNRKEKESCDNGRWAPPNLRYYDIFLRRYKIQSHFQKRVFFGIVSVLYLLFERT